MKLRTGMYINTSNISREDFLKVCEIVKEHGFKIYNESRSQEEINQYIYHIINYDGRFIGINPTIPNDLCTVSSKEFTVDDIIDPSKLSKSILKTGMLVVRSTVEGKKVATVLLDTENGDIIAGDTWAPLDNAIRHGEIEKVYQPKYNCDFISDGICPWTTDKLEWLNSMKLVWERPSEEDMKLKKEMEEIEEQQRILADRMNTLKSQL